MNSGILSTAVYFPDKILTKADLVRMGADPAQLDKWGIQERRVAVDETATDMEAKAGLLAIKRAGLGTEDIDLVIGVKFGAEKPMPPNILRSHYKMGLHRAAAFEVDLACAGSIPAMMMADVFVRAGQYKKVLLVGSCWLDKTADPTDAAVFAVVGDGASAVVVHGIHGRWLL